MTSTLAFERLHFYRLDSQGAARMILRDIHWSVQPAQIAAVLGANGSGKSTLLRLAAGYLWPQRGKVELLGQVLGSVPLAPLRARIGIVEANTVYPFDETITTREVVMTGYFSSLTLHYAHPTAEQQAHAQDLLGQVGLGARSDQLYFSLSTGERMRTLLARALVRRPELLLLDEPTAGLDLPARETLLATLARLHQESATPPAIITITHHLEELLPSTENVLLLSTAGQTIAQGPPQSVLTDAHLSAAYGLGMHVTERNGRYAVHIDPTTWDDLIP